MAEVAGTEVVGGEAAGGEDTTADGAIGTQATIDGTADGDGGAAVLTHGGCFSRRSSQFQFRTQLTADMATGRDMDTVQGMDTEEDTDLDWRFPRLPGWSSLPR
jgi:hypothetical protein